MEVWWLGTYSDLWKLLVKITTHKAIDQARREGRRRALDESDILEQLTGRGPTPLSAARIKDEFDRLLELLGNEKLRATAMAKFGGDTDREAATRLGCSLATVERRLHLIRQVWSKEAPT